MSRISVTDINGNSAGDVEFPDALLVLKKGDQAVHDVIVAHRARLRSGTASTLTKGQVAGSNKKPWKQKGLGRARAGYRQSPIWRGGGVAFGPHPRSYAKKVPKKVAQLAFRRAFSEKLSQQSVLVVKDFGVAEPRTRLLTEAFKAMKINGTALIVLNKIERNVLLAARNLQGVEVVLARDVNTYQLIRHTNIIVDNAALSVIENRMKRVKGGAE